MSKEVLSAISYSHEIASYSTWELRELFNEWLKEIEKEVLDFLNGKESIDPEAVAKHFRLERESAVFILNKLSREGSIDLSISGK